MAVRAESCAGIDDFAGVAADATGVADDVTGAVEDVTGAADAVRGAADDGAGEVGAGGAVASTAEVDVVGSPFDFPESALVTAARPAAAPAPIPPAAAASFTDSG